MGAHTQSRVALRPLLDDLPYETSMTEAAELLDVDRTLLQRWKNDGVPYWSAERLATRRGVHPSSIWTDWIALTPYQELVDA